MCGCKKILDQIFDNVLISFQNPLYTQLNIQDGIEMINTFYFCLLMTIFCRFLIGQKFRNLLEPQQQNLYDILKVQIYFLKVKFF